MIMKKTIFLLVFLLLTFPVEARDLACTKASCIRTDTTDFDGILSGTDTRTQTALDTIDDISYFTQEETLELMVEVAGDTMTGDLDMDGNDINNIDTMRSVVGSTIEMLSPFKSTIGSTMGGFLKIPTGLNPVVDDVGEIAFDTNLITQGMMVVYGSTLQNNVVATANTPLDGQVPKYYSPPGTILWGDESGGGSGTECVSASCDLHADTELNEQGICLEDGTDCPAAGSGDFLADGTVPMTGELDMDGNDINNIDTMRSVVGSTIEMLSPFKSTIGSTMGGFLKIPTGLNPVVDDVGEIAFDTDLITQGMLVVYGSTLQNNVVATANTPLDGQVPKYHSSPGTILWGDESGGAGGATALDDIGDPDAATSISLDDGEHITINSAEDAGAVITINMTDADAGGDIFGIEMIHAGDANSTYKFMRFYDNTSDEQFAVNSNGNIDTAGTLTTGSWILNEYGQINDRKIHDTAATSPEFNFQRACDGDPTDDVADEDYIGEINFKGYHTDEYSTGAIIQAIVDAATGEDDMPARIEFLTSADGSDAPTLALTIDSAQNSTFAGIVDVDGNEIQNIGTLLTKFGSTQGQDDAYQGSLTLYGDHAAAGGVMNWYNSVDEDGTEESWHMEPQGTNFWFGPVSNTDAFIFASAGNFTAIGNVAGATYASNATVTDAELIFINSLSSNAQTQITTNAGLVDSGAKLVAIFDNAAVDVGTGVWTFAGVTLAANENLTLGGETVDHDGTDFVFSDSVKATTSFIIGAADMAETDLEKLDGITDGTAANNKAVVLDGSKGIATITQATITTAVVNTLKAPNASTLTISTPTGEDIFIEIAGMPEIFITPTGSTVRSQLEIAGSGDSHITFGDTVAADPCGTGTGVMDTGDIYFSSGGFFCYCDDTATSVDLLVSSDGACTY